MLKRILPLVLMWIWIASTAGAVGLDFVPNVGQARDGSAFSTEIPGAHVAFRNTSFDYTFAVSGRLAPARMEMIGANPRPEIAGAGLLPGIVNVHTSIARFSEIPTYGGLRYTSVYPGIDLEIDGAAGNLKSTWVVAPRVDPARIRWRYEGFDHVVVDREGNLNLTLPAEPGEEPRVVIETAPVAWQNVEGSRVPVEVRYQERKDGSLSFEVGSYDEEAPLVIDPTLIYNKKLPYTSSGDGIAVDADGNIYLGGVTALGDGYVAKLNKDAVRQWISYFEEGWVRIEDVALGPDNQVYVAGSDGNQGFTAKLDKDGTSLYAYTYGDLGKYSIAVDAQGNSYVTGALALTKRNAAGTEVYTKLFPIAELSGVAVNSLGNPVVTGSTLYGDVYVGILDAGGEVVDQTVFGGSSYEYSTSVVLDGADRIYVVGATASEDFRLANPVDGVLTDGGGCKGPCLDGFITKWGSDLDVLWFGTYFGGNADDVVEDVAVEADGTIHVAGWTRTDDGGGFPIANSIASFLGGEDAFAAKLIMDGRGNYGTDFSTPLGDSSEDMGSSIALGGADIYVSGTTFGSGEYTAFVARLRSNLMPRGNVVNINFQPKESEIPEGYLPDSGQPYGLQDGLWSYGWVPFGQNDQPKLIANELHEVRDQQYDTYVGLAELEKTVLQWEIGLKRGRYNVRLVVGDPRGTQPPLPSDWAQIYAEGVPFISEWRAVAPGDTWMDRTVTVEVTDGRLTLTLDTRAEEWWLCLAFLEISSATSLNQPPKVSLTAPLGSERFNGGRPVTIHAEAEDSDGKVEKVAFHATNSLGKRFPLGVDTTAPYSVNWGCPAYGIPCNPGVYPGRYRIDAVATDDSGATRQSPPIDIFVERLETKRDSFKAELRIFLPDETMPIPDPLASGDEVTRGDDRDFSSTSQEYRVLQRVTLIPSKALDEDGIEEGSMANLRGGTAKYDLGSSVNPVNGRLTPKARSEAFTEPNKGFPYMLDYGTLAALPAVIPMPRPGAWTSGAHFTGAVFDPLLVGDCQLLWDLALTIDATDPSFPVARVQGMYGGFPAFEIYVDGEPVYQWKPPAGRTAEHLCKPGAELVDSGFIYLK